MQGFDVRWSASGGLGYKIVDNKAMTLNLKAGPAWCHTNFLHQPEDDELTGLAGLDFGWQLSPAIKLTQTASTIIGETTTSPSSRTPLNAKLSGGPAAPIAHTAALHPPPPPAAARPDNTGTTPG